jgi:hypothetical protein
VRAFCIVTSHPLVEVYQEFIKRWIDFLAEGNLTEFFFNGSVKEFTGTVGLGMACFGLPGINIFNNQVE